jgi:hypothetical protein
MRQLPYLFFRRHTYLPNEQAYEEGALLSSFCTAFGAIFLLAWNSQLNAAEKFWCSTGKEALPVAWLAA